MTHDRQLILSVGANRQDMNWKQQVISVSELYDRLRLPVRSTETQAEYMSLKKTAQDALKDVGGFVGGALKAPRRKSANVTGRDLITLDFDNIPGWGAQSVITKLDELGCGYAVYSTRKHTPNKPRLRVLIPLGRTATPDEYEPVARNLAKRIGIEMTDPTTFEVGRLMYWPSCSLDGEYIFKAVDAPLADVDGILSQYTNWKNVLEWPQVPGSFNYQKLATKQGDPETKKGIVGAFCRTYDVYAAMEQFIPGIYDATADDDRYTYTGGSTAGGAVVYEHGKFLFSHHATDPCSQRLVNSFDMVRLHKFSDLDADYDTDSATATPKLPSYRAMCEMVNQDDMVMARVVMEQQAQVASDFEGLTVSTVSAVDAISDTTPDENASQGQNTPPQWLIRLERDENGKIKGTINNILMILENDPRLKGCFAMNKFSGRGEVLGQLPWEAEFTRRMWDGDSDTDGMYWYMERFYKITKRPAIDSALSVHSATHAFNEVQDYINGLVWDGIRRLDSLFIDYLGAADNSYTRSVTRKAFVAAIARAMEPGCKFDNMLILCGSQGLGKSTILDRMSRGWFNDSIRTFEGKEASELLQGVWLVEVAELDAFRKTDVARIKQFLSLRADRYRAAYGRSVKELPRCCVFFGTCNQFDFLQDPTGNRRFWPVDVGVTDPVKRAWSLDPETVSQIWAEAKTRWQCGESLYLSEETEKYAQIQQDNHREASVHEGMIEQFINLDIPEDWDDWTIDRRRDFWANQGHGDYTLIKRKRVCALEVWCELFNGNPKDFDKIKSREINAAITALTGWSRHSSSARCGPYGKARCFVRDLPKTIFDRGT